MKQTIKEKGADGSMRRLVIEDDGKIRPWANHGVSYGTLTLAEAVDILDAEVRERKKATRLSGNDIPIALWRDDGDGYRLVRDAEFGDLFVQKEMKDGWDTIAAARSMGVTQNADL